MPLEPGEIFQLMLGVHIPGLTEEETQILAASLVGWKSSAIAEKLFKSDRDVRRTTERLLETLCRPSGTEHSLGLFGLWASAHVGCAFRCSADIYALLEQGNVFPSADTSP